MAGAPCRVPPARLPEEAPHCRGLGAGSPEGGGSGCAAPRLPGLHKTRFPAASALRLSALFLPLDFGRPGWLDL